MSIYRIEKNKDLDHLVETLSSKNYLLFSLNKRTFLIRDDDLSIRIWFCKLRFYNSIGMKNEVSLDEFVSLLSRETKIKFMMDIHLYKKYARFTNEGKL